MEGSLAMLRPLPPDPRISIVIPTFNEEQHIGACLDSLQGQTYPASLVEIVVADGGSADRTREIVELHMAGAPEGGIKLLDNPDRSAAHGLRLGAAAATGDVIVIIGAHATADPMFIEESVRALRESCAAAVGGSIHTIGETRLSRAIAAAVSHPFGVGDAQFRFSRQLGDVDTIAFAAYRRECFDVVGTFSVVRANRDDDQYNWRIRRAGGRLYLTPRIRSTYYARSSYRALARQYLGYGRAKGCALLEETQSLGPRHLVPLGVLVGGSALALLSPASIGARAMLAAAAAIYAAIGIYAAYRSTAQRGERSLAPAAALAFPVIHLSYAVGTILGILDALRFRADPATPDGP